MVMPIRKRLSRTRRLALPVVAATLIAAAPAFGRAADDDWPTAVTASYKLFFAGFEVGRYNFRSTTEGAHYSTKGSASVSALFGAFKWRGGIESSGTLDAATPRPAAYKLDFRSKKKRGLVELGFDNGAVKFVNLVPNKPPRPDAVPVKPEQLSGVFDPMSSILAMTHASDTDPCDRTIPIFDGKARFNLALSPMGRRRIADSNGKPLDLKVCRVKYVPISGHKPKDFVKPWVDYDGIEIALRPVPKANIYVPYQVTIPTTIGAAEMLADRVNITASNNTRIALRR
jgi:hypothetical protein